MTQRRPLWQCKYCDEKRYSVIGCWGLAQHMWEVHGIPKRKFTMNGRTRYYGPQNPLKRWLLLQWRTLFPLNRTR